jgi:hypothetical protein
LGSLIEGGETQVNQEKADDRFAVFVVVVAQGHGNQQC